LIERAIRAKHRYCEENEKTPKRARHQNTYLQLQRIECSDPSRLGQIGVRTRAGRYAACGRGLCHNLLL
jgi:hypothetical protein